MDMETVEEVVRDTQYLLLGADSRSFQFKTEPLLTVSITYTIRSNSELQHVQEIVQLALIIKKLSLQPLTVFKSDVHAAFLDNINEIVRCFQTELDEIYTNNKPTSLLEVNCKLTDWSVIFKHIYWLNIRCSTLNASDFLSLLFEYSLHGDTLIADHSLRIFNSCKKNYFDLIQSWVLKGSFDSSCIDDSFFITKEKKFNSSKVPSFITNEFALKVYHIGRAIDFIQNYLHHEEWVNDYYCYYCLEDFNQINVELLYKFVIDHLDESILTDFQNEVSYLNRFLLFNQGDLINAIIEKGTLVLNKQASTLSSYQLIDLLKDSIDICSVSCNVPPDVYNRIDARLLNIDIDTSIGWDLFTLDFKLIPPIQYIVSKSYKEYLRVFNFLLKIKHLRRQLSLSWKKSNFNYKKSPHSVHNLKNYQRKFNLIRHQFISFIDTIFSYIENEILIVNFIIFQQNLTPTRINLRNGKLLPVGDSMLNLDDLQRIHNDYILSISRSDLFSNDFNQILYQLIIIVQRFASLAIEFDQSISDIHQLESLNQSTDLSSHISSISLKIDKIMKKLNKDIVTHFENCMNLLIQSLRNSSKSSLISLSHILEV